MKLIYLMAGLLLLTASCFGNSPVNGWGYEYGVGSPGTRSESVYGKLFYNNDMLPKEYKRVITPVGEFVFIDGRGFGSNEKISWVPVGKFPDGTMMPAGTKKDVDQLLSGKDPSFRTTATKNVPTVVSEEPYLEGTFENRPRGVGVDWFFVVKQNLWVNPQKIDEVLKTKLIKPVSNQ